MSEYLDDDGWTVVRYRRGRLDHGRHISRPRSDTYYQPVNHQYYRKTVPYNHPVEGPFWARTRRSYADAVSDSDRSASYSHMDYNYRQYGQKLYYDNNNYDQGRGPRRDERDYCDQRDLDQRSWNRERGRFWRGPRSAAFRPVPDGWRGDDRFVDPAFGSRHRRPLFRPGERWGRVGQRHYARPPRPWQPSHSRERRPERRRHPTQQPPRGTQSSRSGERRRRLGQLPRQRWPSLSREGTRDAGGARRQRDRPPPHPPSTDDETPGGRGEGHNDSSFKRKVRLLHRLIKSVHHSKNMSDLDKPPCNIGRMTENLTSFIRPAAMTDRTRLLLEGNAKNWAHTVCLILKEHYTEVLEEQLLSIELMGWDNVDAPFNIAVRWARRKLGRRLAQDTIDHAKELIQTRLTKDAAPATAMTMTPSDLLQTKTQSVGTLAEALPPPSPPTNRTEQLPNADVTPPTPEPMKEDETHLVCDEPQLGSGSSPPVDPPLFFTRLLSNPQVDPSYLLSRFLSSSPPSSPMAARRDVTAKVIRDEIDMEIWTGLNYTFGQKMLPRDAMMRAGTASATCLQTDAGASASATCLPVDPPVLYSHLFSGSPLDPAYLLSHCFPSSPLSPPTLARDVTAGEVEYILEDAVKSGIEVSFGRRLLSRQERGRKPLVLRRNTRSTYLGVDAVASATAGTATILPPPLTPIKVKKQKKTNKDKMNNIPHCSLQ